MRTVFLLLAWLASTPAAQAGIPQGRLPDEVTPTAYRLDLQVDPSRERFSGHAEIDALLAHPSSLIYLHGNALRVTSARILAGGKTYRAQYDQVDPSGVARLDLGRTPPAGRITLQFDYSG